MTKIPWKSIICEWRKCGFLNCYSI